MLSCKTVFVLGAGASVEVGLPTGAELTQQIASMLDMRWSNHQQTAGDRLIAGSLIHRSKLKTGDSSWDISEEVRAARRISAAMVEALSIDNYMEAHSDDPAVMLVGKMAIARAISLAEHKSKLWVDSRVGKSFDPKKTTNTWYHSFWQLLHQGVTKSTVGEIFQNLTIISFNYDRCIQQRLLYGLKSYYNLDDETSQSVLNQLKIYYPYGSLGPLQTSESFGQEYGEAQLIEVAKGIKTYSERVDDAACIDAIASSIAEANRVVLLGFGFHPQNVLLLSAQDTAGSKATYATAYGIPPSNLGPIELCLTNMVGRNHRPIVDFSTCNEFFRNQWYHLIQ